MTDMDLTKELEQVEVLDNQQKQIPEGGPVEDSKKDTKKLLIAVFVIFALFAAVFGVAYLRSGEDEPLTIDGLHTLNVKGKLAEEEGYLYNGFSFVKYNDVWYTQVEKGNTIYDITFNNDPRSVEQIPVSGNLGGFASDNKVFVTFDPEGEDLKFVAVANYGLSRSLVRAFGYEMKAGCTKNVTKACGSAGVITCDDKDKSVIFFREADDPAILLKGNCVVVQGSGEDIVRAKDRLLLRWYGISNY
ncbi:hypothetical protein ACFL0V_03605 [Nanoarchaeota archaeon]